MLPSHLNKHTQTIQGHVFTKPVFSTFRDKDISTSILTILEKLKLCNSTTQTLLMEKRTSTHLFPFKMSEIKHTCIMSGVRDYNMATQHFNGGVSSLILRF